MASSSTPSTPLLYACVAHNTTILAECTTAPAASTASSLASLVLPKIEHASPQRLTYTHGAHHIHYVAASPSEYPPTQPTAGALTYLVVVDTGAAGGAAASAGGGSSHVAASRRASFAFLAELRNKFLAAYPAETTDFSDLPDYGAAGFNGELRRLMIEFGRAAADGTDGDALGAVQREMDDVRGVMTRNIEGLLERGDRIQLLVDKTDRLGGSAREFRLRSRGLKRKMWWKNVKLMGLLGLVVVLILLTIFVSIKGGV
ncbi:hypothetical protein VTJ83DRAFT_4870 [Remersonia thermophila]|uniref:Synaptobrevin homolog YKT6 n=1 Tax=Remersonia thermophila TaxID=72144 RepID=A0ABR4DB63_9PEZI